MYRLYSLKSSDGDSQYIGLNVHKYTYTTDEFSFGSFIGSLEDTLGVLKIRVKARGDSGIVVYNDNGAVKVQKFTISDGFVGICSDITSPAYYDYLVDVSSGFRFSIPTSYLYFTIAYTSGIPLLPNTEDIIYVETEDGTYFSAPDTLNDHSSTLPVLSNYPSIFHV